MGIATAETGSGWPSYAKLMQGLSWDGCGDCGGAIDGAKGHVSFKARNG
jgi:hypothetical protein